MTDEKIDETSGFITTNDDAPVFEPKEDEVTLNSGQDEGESQDQEAEAKPSKGESKDKVDGDNAAAEHDDKGDSAKDEPKKSNRVQKRIDQVVREREEERRKNEKLQRQLDELTKGKDNEKSAGSDKEPIESDFETYDEYLDAIDKFDSQQETSVDEKPKPEDNSGGDDSEASTLTDAQRTAMAVIKEKVQDGTEKYPDFNEVALDDQVPITGEMLEAIAECDDPIKVMYHLGQNKDLAANIADSSPAQQMREIAKLDLTVEVKPPKPIKTTQAADPIKPVGGADAQQKPVTEMSFSEYEAHMNKVDLERGKGWS